MEDGSSYNVPAVAYVLQSRTSSVAERIAALRSLKRYLEENKSMDAYSKKRIKQLILDNVLQLILSEEKVTNVVKRQMVRTELFLILANLLDSSVLFGSIFGTEVPHPGSSQLSSDSAGDTVSNSPTKPSATSRALMPPGGWVKRKRGQQDPQPPGSPGQTTLSHSQSAKQLSPLVQRDVWSPAAGRTRTASTSSGTGGLRRRTSSQSAELTLLKPLIRQQARNQRLAAGLSSHTSKTWKPRPSVLHSHLVADNFVPGADPLNYFEQDRKLGYQKPRMWFPGAVVSAHTALLPEHRHSTKQSATEQVVQEFLQMRSLASYVGDLVMPYNPIGPRDSYMTSTKATVDDGSGKSAGKTSRLSNLTDHERFNAALKEVAAVWSPLLGLHLPPQDQLASLPGSRQSTRKRKHSASTTVALGVTAVDASGRPLYQEYAQEIVPFKCLRVEGGGTAGKHHHRRPPTTAGEGPASPGGSVHLDSASLPRPISRLDETDDEARESRSNNLYLLRAQQYQGEVSAYLQAQKEHVLASIQASERLIAATIKSGYQQLFGPKYLLLLEGKKANSRALIASAMAIFCRVKRANLLATAFGSWKILLVQMASVARRPLYSRVAACHLMARWQQEVHLKKLRVWIVRWRRRAGALIFIQRNQEVIKIQTLYRTWRDRRKFVAMHLAKTFQGVLSDVYLGPKRKGLLFFIPDIIRSDRRLLWLAATIIQTVFRCWSASKEFFYKRRMVLLIQSIIRMFPRYRKYKRLKKTTIKCQAWARRTVKRKQYKRLKRATIIVQKYVRRYLGILLKLRIFDRMWRDGARPLAAAIRIQCRYRIRLAKKKIRGKRFIIAKRKYSALVIQRNYYRYKRAFHTFFLMCCLREREALDLQEIKKKTQQDRHAAATVIQQKYKERYFKRMLGAIVKVQCWIRGRMGYGLVDILRKERWAGRKIRSWVKVRVRRRRKMARRIQRWWWALVPSRLRKHLWWRLMLSDQAEDQERSERRHFAAMRIQAYVKGVWDRRWVRRHRAALIIQKNAKFFFAMKRWRRWKREKIMKVVRRYATYVEERAVKSVLARILRKHSDNMKKPQALARGFIVRTIMRRAKWMAFRIGIAAVRIQRFWRKTGAMGKAVEEVMALRRERSNPFVPCSSIHEVLVMMRRQTRPYYSSYDPRVGLRVSAFLYRLGCQDLAEMFPRRHYVVVSDMAGLTLYKLMELYESWKTRSERGKDKNQQGSVKVKKKQAPPTQLFETIFSIVNPPLFTTIPKHREKIKTILTLPEYEVPQHAMEGFKKAFQRKFGKNLNARAEHLAKDILQMAWGEFNNYKTVGAVLTKHQLLKAINMATESNNPLHLLEEVRARPTSVVEEKKWDRERISKTAELLQLAVDRLLLLLPAGKLRGMVERANNRVASYRRKLVFLRQKITAAANPAPAPERRNSTVSVGSDFSGASASVKTAATAAVNSVAAADPAAAAQVVPVEDQRGALDLTAPGTLQFVLPITRSLELPFTSTSLADLELEADVSICRVFFDALDRLYMMTAAVQSLKNSWHNNTLRRAVAKEKAAQLKEALKSQYLQQRGEDKVKKVWLKHKRLDTSNKKLEIIMKAVIARKAGYKFELSFIPRYGWVSVEDANGYYYWMDTKPRGAEESTYDMPVYSVPQYFMLLKMQKAGRRFLDKLHERKRIREAEARAEVARLEAIMEEERRKGARVVKSRFNLVSRLLDSAIEKMNKGKHHYHEHHSHHHKLEAAVPTVESLLPWRYRFYVGPVYHPGTWALLRSKPHSQHADQAGAEEQQPAEPTYEIVTVFRIRESDGLCDVRTVKGVFHRSVHINRLCIMNLDVGAGVEVRYKQEQVFYRAKITHIDTVTAQQPLYSIRYEDGETATGLQWDSIRPSLATLKAFLRGRKENMRAATQRHRRLMHFHKLKRERVLGYEARVLALWETAIANNPQLMPLEEEEGMEGMEGTGWGSGSRPASPLLLQDGEISPPRSPSSPTADVEGVEGKEEGAAAEGQSAEAGADTATTLTASERATMPTVTSALVSYEAGQQSSEQGLLPVLPRPRFRIDFKLWLPYSKVCNVFGWRTCEDYNAAGRKYYYYVNTRTDEVTDTQPTYSALEVQSARRVQLAWRIYAAKCSVRRRVLALNVAQLIADTIKKGAKVAYIGYELEGVTSMQMMRRAGYWELADVFEAHYKGLKWNIANLSIEEIAKKPRDEYENLGVIQMTHQRDLKEFQTWWARSTVAEKQRRLALFNYFKSPLDERDIKTCILESEELMVAKFAKYIKTGAARTRAAVQMLLGDAHFPHSHMQVDTYLKKYGDKAELARDSVFELVNKPTTHTWVEEKVVLRHYRACTRLIRAVLGNLKLRSLRSVVLKVEKKVDAILKSVPTGANRLACTGPEAKAALLLRTEVLKYLQRVLHAVEVIQRNVRTYMLSKKWSVYLVLRTKSIDLLQRTARKYLAMKIHRSLTAQKMSAWEQLWDSRRNLLYYYNHVTGISQYNEPDEPFRPLVRDPLSSALIQAWPDLDNRGGMLALLPPSQGGPGGAVAMLASHTHCGICKTRKCVRICSECTDEVDWDPAKHMAFPYCFTCFMKEHPEDNTAKANHQYTIVGEGEGSSTALAPASAETLYLRCCMCEQPATRKCQGMIDEDQVEEICAELKRTAPDGWLDVLKAANVAGDRKLTLLLDQIRSESNAVLNGLVAFQNTEAAKETNAAAANKGKHHHGHHKDQKGGRGSPIRARKGAAQEPEQAAEPAQPSSPPIAKMLSVAHLQAVRTLLERQRAECDECYCATCYKEVHAGGKRALHKWKGFKARAHVCTVCTNCPAEYNCFDCETKYCGSCYRVFHSMGRKRNHKREKVLEELSGEEVYCGFCERRPANCPCDNRRCHTSACDSCLEFRHKPQCNKELAVFGGAASPSGKNRRGSVAGDAASPDAGGDGQALVAQPKRAVQSNAADTDPDACVVCGEEADQKCVQCGDCYCSRTWMGNPGCFAQHHSKGNRTAHTTELYMSRRALVASMKRSKSMRASRKSMLTQG